MILRIDGCIYFLCEIPEFEFHKYLFLKWMDVMDMNELTRYDNTN